jgi:hypothetical protein
MGCHIRLQTCWFHPSVSRLTCSYNSKNKNKYTPLTFQFLVEREQMKRHGGVCRWHGAGAIVKDIRNFEAGS